MLFNSFEFILVFLPLRLLAARLCLGRGGQKPLIGVLLAASFFFYAWWAPRYLLLLLFSILVNSLCGRALRRATRGDWNRYLLLTFGIAFNLCLIGYFKYAEFYTVNINQVFDLSIPLVQVVLPIAISFYTFSSLHIWSMRSRVRRRRPHSLSMRCSFRFFRS